MIILKFFKKTAICSILVMSFIAMTSSMPVGATSTQSVKLVKGKLVYTKTLKPVTKKTIYKNKLYVKGGKLATGTVIFNKKQYVKGVYKADHTKPVFKLPTNFKAIYNVKNGEKFTLPTLKATDKVSGKVTVTKTIKDSAKKTIKKINTKVTGSYVITYTAKDAAGNRATKSIKVIVTEPKKLQFTQSTQTLKPGTSGKINLQEVIGTKKNSVTLPNKAVTFFSYSDFISVNDDGRVYVSKLASAGHKAEIKASYIVDGKRLQAVMTVQVAADSTNKDAVQFINYAKNYEVVNDSKYTKELKIAKGAAVSIYSDNNVVSTQTLHHPTNLYLTGNHRAVISYENANAVAPKPVNSSDAAILDINETDEEAFIVVKLRKNGSVYFENSSRGGGGDLYLLDSNNKAKATYASYVVEEFAGLWVDEVLDRNVEVSLYSGCQAVVTNEHSEEFIVYAPARGVEAMKSEQPAVLKEELQPGETGIIHSTGEIPYDNMMLITSPTAKGSYNMVEYSGNIINDFAFQKTVKTFQEISERNEENGQKVIENIGDSTLVLEMAQKSASFEKVATNGEKSSLAVANYDVAPGKKVLIQTTATSSFNSSSLLIDHDKNTFVFMTLSHSGMQVMKGPSNKYRTRENVALLTNNDYIFENTSKKTIHLVASAKNTTIKPLENQEIQSFIVNAGEKVRISNAGTIGNLFAYTDRYLASYNVALYDANQTTVITNSSDKLDTRNSSRAIKLPNGLGDFENTGSTPITLYSTNKDITFAVIQ